jgi:transposase InsO family protein
MNERPTDIGRRQKQEEVHGKPEAGDFKGVGSRGERGGGGSEEWYSSHDPVSLEEAAGGRCGGVSQGEPTLDESEDQGSGKRESEPQGNGDPVVTGVDAFKKKDELGLTGRVPGARYSGEQKERILKAVEGFASKGVSTAAAVRKLGVPRSTFYAFKAVNGKQRHLRAPNALLEEEIESIVCLKMKEPSLSHRQISGLLRRTEVWVSPSSCYRTLKSRGLVWEWALREAPWKTARYEPFQPNRIWAEDWTGLVIDGLRHYLLTILDLFSRYVVAWGIVKTVTQKEVKNLVALAVMSQGIDRTMDMPILRTDPGSPNMAADVRIFLREIGIGFSPGRTGRPTDNARQERFYRTLKQEEIYCRPDYLSIDSARHCIACWIEYYNEIRPHQALSGYTPGILHRTGNKTKIMEEYRKQVALAKQKRHHVYLLNKNHKLTPCFS